MAVVDLLALADLVRFSLLKRSENSIQVSHAPFVMSSPAPAFSQPHPIS